ncbi:MAG TPA: hypothetical protein VFA60_12605 [Terriglobales bacterium]|nr:hypothetical protein [Terriglobales bacterium]
MKCITRLLLAIGTAAALCSAPAFAKDHGQGHGKDKFEKHDRDHDRDDRWRRDHDRDDHFRHANSGTPPGWRHGRKTGWGNCDLPPGQAKKQGCHSTWVNHRDRDRDRRIWRDRAENRRERERRERERREPASHECARA